MDIRELIYHSVLDKTNIGDSAWSSHGYEYKFVSTGYGDGSYCINAGCRYFYSFAEFKKHYSVRWLGAYGYHYGGRNRRRYRSEALAICDKMQAFAIEYGVPMPIRNARKR